MGPSTVRRRRSSCNGTIKCSTLKPPKGPMRILSITAASFWERYDAARSPIPPPEETPRETAGRGAKRGETEPGLLIDHRKRRASVGDGRRRVYGYLIGRRGEGGGVGGGGGGAENGSQQFRRYAMKWHQAGFGLDF